MVEREVETTVAVEREREVTETYLDEEAVTETFVICDACGEACDERGGRHRLVTVEDAMAAINIEEYREEISSAMSEELDELSTYRVGGMPPSGGYRTVDLSIEQEIERASFDDLVDATISGESMSMPVDAETTSVVDKVRLDHRIQKVIDEATSAWDEYDPVGEDHDHDICSECREALDFGASTLDTAAYESIDETTTPDADRSNWAVLNDRFEENPSRVVNWSLGMYGAGVLLAGIAGASGISVIGVAAGILLTLSVLFVVGVIALGHLVGDED